MSVLGSGLMMLGFIGIAISYSHKNTNRKLWLLLMIGTVFVVTCSLTSCEFLPPLKICFTIPNMLDPNTPPLISITPIP